MIDLKVLVQNRLLNRLSCLVGIFKRTRDFKNVLYHKQEVEFRPYKDDRIGLSISTFISHK